MVIYFHSVHTSVFKSAPNSGFLADAALLRFAAVPSEARPRELQITIKERCVLRIEQIQGYQRLREKKEGSESDEFLW